MTKLRYVRFAAGYGAVFDPNHKDHPVDRSAIIDGKDGHGILWEAFDNEKGVIVVRATRASDNVFVETHIPYSQLALWTPFTSQELHPALVPAKIAAPAKK